MLPQLSSKASAAIATALADTSSRMPVDCASAVFLPRALDVLGQAMHGGVWTGREPHTQVPPVLPKAIAVMTIEAEKDGNALAVWFDPPNRQMLDYAAFLLTQYRPDLRRPRGQGMFSDLGPPQFTVVEWEAAQSVNDVLRAEAFEKLGRWNALQRKFVQLCEAGILETVVRPIKGGALSLPLSPDLWRFEAYWLRMMTNQIDLAHPFDDRPDQKRTHWIFVTRDSLDRARLQIAPRSRPQSIEQYQSEYMLVMDDVIRSMAITTENQPKKVEVEHAIKGLAPWMTKTERKYLASFIRMRAGKLGRNRPAAP